MVVLAMIATVFFVTPVRADDQAKTRIEPFASNPSGMTFYNIAWDEQNWSYALAVGEDTSGNGWIKKYNFTTGVWDNVFGRVGTVFYDIVADMNKPDTFYVVGQDTGSGTTSAGIVEHAETASPSYTDLPSANLQGAAFYGCTFDAWQGSSGSLIAVGTDTTTNGIIDVFDVYSQTWTKRTTAPGDVLKDATWNYYNAPSYIVVVGNNGGAGIAYSYDYSSANIISVPSGVGPLHGVDWRSNDYMAYALVVGEDTSGVGKVWMIDSSWNFYELSGTDASTPILNGVDWDANGDFAVIVGNGGYVYMHYAWDDSVISWTDSTYTDDLYGVAVKSPGSPGYGLGVGAASSPIISYQVSDTSTGIILDTVFPHLNAIDFRDSAGNSKLNQQVDVGSTYYFFINASYSQGWGNVELDIYGWYDYGDDTSNYNDTLGANLNFHLHYVPDSTDPVNNAGTWTVVWPIFGEISYVNSQQTVADDPAGSNPGIADDQDYFHLYVNISFAEQVRWAPGDGVSWDAAADQTDRVSALNDINSWNFNVSVYDTGNTNAKQTRYDEFGIFSYTEVSASQNPSGAGPPGTRITLSSDSEVVIRTNRFYYVTVNVTDLKNGTGATTISRANIEVQNSHVDNGTAPTDIMTWTAFTSPGPLWLWGQSAGPTYMGESYDGTYSAGYQYGYDSTTYTPVSWRVNVPPTTPEDHFTATITYEISYA